MRGDAHGRSGDAELTDGCINIAAIERTATAVVENRVAKLWMLQIGKIGPGQAPPLNTAIENQEEPPRMNTAMQQAKMKLGRAQRWARARFIATHHAQGS